MNFFSSALSSLTGTSIPYTFKDKIVDPKLDSQYPQIWTVYNGANPKNDNVAVTIFEFSLKDPVNISRGFVPLARNCFLKCKVLKLPGIVSIIEFKEDDNYLYIVTEPVVPLYQYLQESAGANANTGTKGDDADAKVFGVHSVGATLALVNQSQCLHANVGVHSVYVTQAGDWKLFGLELTTNLTSDPDQPIYRLSGSMPGFGATVPGEGLDGIRQFPLKFDSFKFGLFIYQVFNFESVTSSVVSAAANMPNLPRQLAGPAKKLVGRPLFRPTVEKFMKDVEATVFNQNQLILFNEELNELKFKNDLQKLDFFKYQLGEFTNSSISFPRGFLDHKLLPELKTQYENIFASKASVAPGADPEFAAAQRQETISILLNSILNFGVNLEEALFAKTIKPVIFQAFTLPDRSIRLSLLNHLSSYAKFLTEQDVQLRIFNQIISGFQDTNFMIRETTLTSITIIIDKVSTKQVNQELLKVLAKSQMDPKPSIRTNTLVLIIKISLKIYSNSKNNVLITALSKSLRDSFVPCKLMALSGFESLINEFSLNEICGKILGHLAISLMDEKSYKIRKEARRVFDLYLNSVEEHAKSLPKDEVDEEEEEKQFFAKNAPATTSAANTEATADESSFAGLSFGFGSLKIGGGSTPSAAPSGPINNGFNVSTPDLTRVGTPTTEPIVPKSILPGKPAVVTETATWDDDFEIEESWGEPEVFAAPPPKKEPVPAKRSPAVSRTIQSRKGSGLKLGSRATPKPKPTLNLNLQIENDDSSWGDEW